MKCQNSICQNSTGYRPKYFKNPVILYYKSTLYLLLYYYNTAWLINRIMTLKGFINFSYLSEILKFKRKFQFFYTSKRF